MASRGWAFIADGDWNTAHLQKIVRSLHVKMGRPDSASIAQMFAKHYSGRSQKPGLKVLTKFKCCLCERRRAIPQRPETVCTCCPGLMKVPEGSGPARPGVQPCGDATWMLVPVTEGTPWEEGAAITLDKSMLI